MRELLISYQSLGLLPMLTTQILISSLDLGLTAVFTWSCNMPQMAVLNLIFRVLVLSNTSLNN